MPEVQLPNLTGDETGLKKGVPGGVKTAQQIQLAATTAGSPQKQVQASWQPGTFLSFPQDLQDNPDQAAFKLDQAFLLAHGRISQLLQMLACRQVGSATVTGSAIGIPTGLATVNECSGSIDTGATPHNFTVSVAKSQTPGAIDITVFKPTANNNNTPILNTTATIVRWIASGSFGT